MGKEIIILGKENSELYFKIKVEEPTLKFKTKRISHSNSIENGKAVIEIAVIYHKFERQTKVSKVFVGEGNNLADVVFPDIINDITVDVVSIKLVENTFAELKIEIEVQYGEDLISIKNPIEEFDKHLSNRSNTKILFSAPFGSGKTTFLDHYFFAENVVRGNYEVFKVFPVNYSVASNEDIFKYIKTDILFQLLGSSDTHFKKSSKKYTKTATEFIDKNLHKILAPFLIAIPKIGKDVYTVFQKLDELKDKYLDYHDSHNVDELKSVTDYISAIYEQEGSLFEDDFYTQLIRQLLVQLKVNKGKENVLIIEDLDRMDPDHIFRILNVISAHYDTYHLNDNEFEHHNKFGFDKIILVCDVKNIEHIFHHKYGVETDFNGYMNKYFSSLPFEFENKKAIDAFLDEVYAKVIQGSSFDQENLAHIQLLKTLQNSNLLSIREVFKILKADFDNFLFYQGRPNQYLLSKGRFTKSIAFLIKVLSKEVLVYKFNRLKKIDFKQDADYFQDSLNVLTSLGNILHDNNFEVSSEYMDQKYYLKYTEFRSSDIINVVEFGSLKNHNENGPEFKIMNNLDFYSLILLLIEKIQFIDRNS